MPSGLHRPGNPKNKMSNPEREAVKMLALEIGIRAAAREMGLDEHRVLKWSQRDPQGPWTIQAQTQHLKPYNGHNGTLSSLSSSPSQALRTSLQTLGAKTRLNLAKAAHRGAKSLKRQPGEAIVRQASNLAQLTTAAAKLHGWEEQQGQAGSVDVQVLCQEGAIRVRTTSGTPQDGA